MKKTKSISLSVNKSLSIRMAKYVTNNSVPRKYLIVVLPQYQYEYYKSIERGKRSRIFSHIIDDFLNVLEKNSDIETLFCSKSELVRNAITYNRIFKKELISLDINPNGSSIDGRIPIGNKYYPEGKWKTYHKKESLLRHSLLEKIYEKLQNHFTMQQIVNDFDKFYEAHKKGLLDVSFDDEKQIRKLKLLIGK